MAESPIQLQQLEQVAAAAEPAEVVPAAQFVIIVLPNHLRLFLLMVEAAEAEVDTVEHLRLLQIIVLVVVMRTIRALVHQERMEQQQLVEKVVLEFGEVQVMEVKADLEQAMLLS